MNELFSEVKNWPTCPECKSRDVISIGDHFSCLSCRHTGGLNHILSSPVGKFAQAITAPPRTEHYNVCQYGPFPQQADEEFGNILDARSTELMVQQVAWRYWEKAAASLHKDGQMDPVAIVWENHIVSPILLSLSAHVDTARDILARNAKQSDVVAVLFSSSNPHADFMDPQEIGGKGFLVMNFHAIGIPARTYSIDASTLTDGMFKVGSFGCLPEPVLMKKPKEIIYSPIDWDVLRLLNPHLSLRYWGGIETESGVNINFAAHENMDTGEISAVATIRELWECEPIKFRDYTKECQNGSIETTMEILTSKNNSMVESFKSKDAKISWVYSTNVNIDANAYATLGKLQKLALWGNFEGLKAVLYGTPKADE